MLALAGDTRAAPALAARHEKESVLDTITRDVFLVTARAALALAQGDARGAHVLLDRSAAYEPRYAR